MRFVFTHFHIVCCLTSTVYLTYSLSDLQHTESEKQGKCLICTETLSNLILSGTLF